ncbi:MAG TPA: tRNA (cytidine(34)-2'-O)-methyltransferase [Phycisphaerales bacterium]|nr:tRNA (cytidine(34)-2'-O)-methyltransferase [Phycisphaerales bacterium]
MVLLEPEIPNNTGNIGRTCVATGCALHLIHPLGFDTSVKALRRAGLDYWPRLTVREHANWEAYLGVVSSVSEPRLWFTSGKRGVPPWEAELRAGDHFVFGKETRGVPDELLDRHPDRALMLPMAPNERGLNVATAVCAVVYEGIRQCIGRGECRTNAQNRLER